VKDPYAVLGVPAGATDEEVGVAYRALAKRHHPDRAPADEARMRDINAAYDQIRASRRPAAAGEQRRGTRRRTRVMAGAWLSAAVRRQLGGELLDSLQPLEDVLIVVDAATWDSPTVRLVVTDRRLLWLRDDAPVGRVRSVRYTMLEAVDGRLSRRRRRGELLVKPRDARRLSFAALSPEALEAVLRAIRPRLRDMRTVS
jgi:curved DNA-binding protein CbpA